jgi:type I restriction enzyme S subunit
MIPLPPLAEQRRIAGILDQADDLRRKRRDTIDIAESLLRSTFLSLFGTKDNWPSRWPSEKLSTLTNPKQWKTISSGELKEFGFPVYGANGVIGFYDEYNHSESTVLITCRGATCGTINVCQPKSYVTGNAMALDDPDARLRIPFLEWVLRIRGTDDAITGSAQPQITRQSLECVTIPLPPVDLQGDFVARADEIDKLKVEYGAHLAKLDALFASLQHRAFRGEL